MMRGPSGSGAADPVLATTIANRIRQLLKTFTSNECQTYITAAE